MTERVDAVVIGAGHNGLICAGYLARAGLRVVCVEAREAVGGMFSHRTLGERYRFPGLAHAAFPLPARIRRDLRLERFGYEPGPAIDTVSLGPGGGHVVLSGNGLAGTGVPESDTSRYPSFRRQLREFSLALRPLMENRPPRLRDVPRRDLATLASLGWNLRMRLGRESMAEFLRIAGINVHDLLQETFTDDRLKGALATDAVLGSAMGPRSPGSVLAWLQRLNGELNGPLSVHTGSSAGVADALKRAAEAAGASVRLNTPVRHIRVENGRTAGVELEGGESIGAATVVSNADPRKTFLELLGAPQLDAMFASRVRQIRGAGTVAKLHLALDAKPEFSGLAESMHGNRLLVAPSANYVERAFNPSKYGEFPESPVLEITIPSCHTGDLAPAGHHVMSVNVTFVPYEDSNGWSDDLTGMSDRVVALLEEFAPGIRSRIVDREFLTPRDVETQYGAVGGHWHHGEITMHQSFMMRPLHGASQYETPIDGLFLCGAGCHPGGGLTGLPGRNAARRVLERGRR